VEEMVAFYELMLESHDAFMATWQERRAALDAGTPTTEETP
jgi:hypothetical protein